MVGAGVSGLCYSYFLSKIRPDVHVTIYNAAPQPGGWIQSLKLDDDGQPLILEKGPRTLRGVSDGTILIADIMRQLGRADDVEVMRSSSRGNRKWLLEPGGSLVQVPNSVMLFVKFMLSDVTQGVVPGVLGEAFRKAKTDAADELIRDFVSRRFGSPALADNILSAVMHGIYSGDVAKLSARATLPLMVAMEQEHGSIIRAMFRKMVSKKPKLVETKFSENTLLGKYASLVSPGSDLELILARLKTFPILRLHNGLQTFPNILSDYLQTQQNITLKYGTPVTELGVDGVVDSQQYDHVRFTLGFKALETLAQGLPQLQQLSHTLQGFEYLSIFLANVFLKTQCLIPDKGNGFGFLVPRRNANPESLLGVIFDSDTELDTEKFFSGEKTGQVPYHKLTLMVGGHYFSSRGIPSNLVNLQVTKKVLSNILGADLSKVNIVVRNESQEQSKLVSLANNDVLISYNLLKDCIPQYNVGFLERTAEVQRLVHEHSGGRVSLGGPCMGKLGVPDCVTGELEAALLHG